MKLSLIGCGTGNIDHITMQGVKALKNADLILIPEKGDQKTELADVGRNILSAHFSENDWPPIAPLTFPTRRTDIDYRQAVIQWHDEIALLWKQAINVTPPPQHIALLIWGDPSLYDSSLRIAARLEPKPILQVIPGISSIQVLTAAHQIPLNRLAEDVTIMTGRNLREKGFPDNVDTIVVMLDGQCSFKNLPQKDYYIYWGAYLGMPQEILCAGMLDTVSEEITEKRLAARQKHGWIMDCYLIRKQVNLWISF